jgi:flagellar biosynthetic protein FliO
MDAGPSLRSGIVGSLLALLFVLALAWLLLRWLKRSAWGQQAAGSEGPRVLRAVSLGPRERLVVVQHHDVELLLGVTAAGVTLLERRQRAAGGDAVAARSTVDTIAEPPA